MAGMAGQQGVAFLHEPDGMPFREVSGSDRWAGTQAALYRVDARDVRAGEYEVDVTPSGQRSRPRCRTARAGSLTTRDAGELAVAELVNVGAREAATVAASSCGSAAGSGRDSVRARVADPGGAVRYSGLGDGAGGGRAMDRAQWGRFTDFGLTLFDSDGRQLGEGSTGVRLRASLGRCRKARRPAGEAVAVPGIRGSGDESQWSVTTTIRLYADTMVAVAGDRRHRRAS